MEALQHGFAPALVIVGVYLAVAAVAATWLRRALHRTAAARATIARLERRLDALDDGADVPTLELDFLADRVSAALRQLRRAREHPASNVLAPGRVSLPH